MQNSRVRMGRPSMNFLARCSYIRLFCNQCATSLLPLNFASSMLNSNRIHRSRISNWEISKIKVICKARLARIIKTRILIKLLTTMKIRLPCRSYSIWRHCKSCVHSWKANALISHTSSPATTNTTASHWKASLRSLASPPFWQPKWKRTIRRMKKKRSK